MRYLLLIFSLFVGCGKLTSKKPEATPGGAAETAAPLSLTQTTDSGPVKATVSVTPKNPRLGDPLTLTLTVEAQPKITVEMPPFGEALGRFSILSFTPRTETDKDGSVKHIQRYVLDAPMSGRQRIPSLRVEFTDDRAGITPDGGADNTHELLTDELAIDIASVLPQDSAEKELRGLRGPLPETMARTRLLGIALPVLALLLAGGAWLLFSRLRRQARLRIRISAFDVAMRRLDSLQERGWPKAEQADPFYVELSDIVRRYIEDRYGVRAPELTTEEFLREAKRELRLFTGDRELLQAFLSSCDQVKFAGYRPAESESRQALENARRFLQDTRLVDPSGSANTSPEAQP
jgi:hypothetical protein